MNTYKAVKSGIFMEHGEGKAAVAYVYHAEADNCDEDERVAKLFAAAPDLLEALRWMQMALNQGSSMDIAIGQEKAEAAIAKALGETK